MLKLNPSLIHVTPYIIAHPDPEYKIREMGNKILDELYDEDDEISSITGIKLLDCCIPLDCDVIDLYHDLYHIFRSINGCRKVWKPKCTLQMILKSYMGYVIYSDISHLSHIFHPRFIKYVMRLVYEMKCNLTDLCDIILRRSLQVDNETQIECTINALGWIDNETYWYMKRNTHVGLEEAKESLGLIVPYNMRYDNYIYRSYMYSTIYDRSPRHHLNYLKVQPKRPRNDIVEYSMKDIDILEKYSMLPRYESKHELITLLRDVQYNRVYEIHNKEKYYGKETAIDMHTIDHNTSELFIIDNNLYTLDELIDSCNNGMKFDRYPISKELAEDLLYFMLHYEELDVCNIIVKYLEDARDPIISMRHEVEKDPLFKQFLLYIIEVGLYTRRWRGHGQPYPYKSTDTDNMDNKLYLRRINNLNVKIMNIVNSNEFSWYRNNIVLHKAYGSMRKKFIPYYIAMIDGNECIRLMSEALIHTGSYYLQVIYGSKYSDNLGNILDINRIEFMNPISPEERMTLP